MITKEQIKKHRDAKLSYREIGELFGITRQRIHQVYKEYSSKRGPSKYRGEKENKYFNLKASCIICLKTFVAYGNSKTCSSDCSSKLNRNSVKKRLSLHSDIVRKYRKMYWKRLKKDKVRHKERKKHNRILQKSRYWSDPKFRERVNKYHRERKQRYKNLLRKP